MVVSACRTALAEGCQDRASALSHLEDSRQGHRTAVTRPPPAQELWPRGATAFEAGYL